MLQSHSFTFRTQLRILSKELPYYVQPDEYRRILVNVIQIPVAIYWATKVSSNISYNDTNNCNILANMKDIYKN